MKICITDASAIKDYDTLIISRNAGFRLLISSTVDNGFKNNIKSVLNYFSSSYNGNTSQDSAEPLPTNMKSFKADKTRITILSRDMDKMVDLTENDVTAIVTVNYVKNPESISATVIVFVDEYLNSATLLKLFKTVSDAKSAALWDLGALNPSSDPLDSSTKDSIMVACRGERENKSLQDENRLYNNVSKCVRHATVESLKKNGFPKDVLGFMEDVGVHVEDLVDSGMELMVGVEKTDEIREKLRKQILKSLKDLNVISFVISAIRLEEDFEKHRIRGVNVDDDPAYLYSDEVFGMAVANQIAGTKAIFNFKRYDESKPGILSSLGPMVDDVFAGIIAGCTSKIFEE